MPAAIDKKDRQPERLMVKPSDDDPSSVCNSGSQQISGTKPQKLGNCGPKSPKQRANFPASRATPATKRRGSDIGTLR
jgi:hypothetical protein